MTYNMAESNEGNKHLVPEGSPIAQMGHTLVRLRQLRDEVKDSYDGYVREVEDLEAKMFDAMEAQNLRSIKTKDGTFSLNDLAWASIEDATAARLWAENNLPEAITLNHTRLTMVVREAIREGQPLPPGVTFRASRKINVRMNK